jgi:hypothetical protein
MSSNGKITISTDGTIARAYHARQVAEAIATKAAENGMRLLVRPQADGTVLLVNGPKYENIWAWNASPRSRKKGRK